ncbi:hypothetical protein RJ639_000119 [Escallonia herrerae]|uniref:Pyruvate carboxyltransferase domain-containing protein n=1 Tax=Escallonia herrerae TaxID=1293975 RepID=A0AA88XJG3_9ASTE|nr:hypothetical protein RJ639_000119 [Escallonia herrerae]
MPRTFGSSTRLSATESKPQGPPLPPKKSWPLPDNWRNLGLTRFPVASKAEFEAVWMIAKEVGNSIDEFGYSPVIGAVSRMVGKDIDLAWEAVKYARHPRMCRFIPTSEIHLKYKLNKTKEEVLKIVKEMVSYTRKLGVTDIQFVSEDSARIISRGWFLPPPFLSLLGQNLLPRAGVGSTLPVTLIFSVGN